MARKANAKGFKIRSTKRKPQMAKLLDGDTGEWLANVRGKPGGIIYLELAKHVVKAVVADK